MNLTGFALNNARFTALVVVLLAVTGFVLFGNFPSKEDPEVTVREAVVAAYFPGMAPERVENLITRKLEKQIRRIPEVRKIKSSSKTGVAIVHVVIYDKYFEMAPIWQDLRNKMQEVKVSLPQGTLGPFVNSDFGDVNVATVALTANGFSLEEMRKVARDIRDDLYALDGIRRVELHGVQQERIFLETTNARLARYGISPDDLIATLEQQNIILPGGKVEVGGYDIVIEPSGNFASVADIARNGDPHPRERTGHLSARRPDGAARLCRPAAVPRLPQRPAGHRAGGLDAEEKRQRTGIRAALMKTKIAEIQDELPIGYALDVRHLSGRLRGRLGRLRHPQRLRDPRHRAGHGHAVSGLAHGLIVGSIVPLTMLVSLVFMRVLDIELERVSLATMIIALGLLVDNGIVIAEDIGRRMAAGKSRSAMPPVGTGKQLACRS